MKNLECSRLAPAPGSLPAPLGGALVSGSLATPVNWLRQLVGLPVGCFLLGVASEIGVGACAPKTQPGAPWESPFRALGFKIEVWAPGCILGPIWLTVFGGWIFLEI